MELFYGTITDINEIQLRNHQVIASIAGNFKSLPNSRLPLKPENFVK